MLKNHWPTITISVVAFFLLKACTNNQAPTSSKPYIPPPNVTLNNISSAGNLLTTCEGDSPACQEQRLATQQQAWNVLNGLQSRQFDPITFKVENINGNPSDGWTIRGNAVWDQDAKNKSDGFGVALLGGLAAAIVDGSVQSGLAVGGSVARESAQIEDGVCLTSFDPTYKGTSEIEVVVQAARLVGNVEEGSIVTVTTTPKTMQTFGRYGIFDDELGSTTFASGKEDFPEVKLLFVTGTVTRVDDAKEYKSCRKT